MSMQLWLRNFTTIERRFTALVKSERRVSARTPSGRGLVPGFSHTPARTAIRCAASSADAAGAHYLRKEASSTAHKQARVEVRTAQARPFKAGLRHSGERSCLSQFRLASSATPHSRSGLDEIV